MFKSGIYKPDLPEPVYDYIQQYWKKTPEKLLETPFDLEECFTLLELQRKETENADAENADGEKAKELSMISHQLKVMLTRLLSEFENHVGDSDLMRGFADLVYKQKPTVITFNYDCILERAIEEVSGLSHEDALQPYYELSRTEVEDEDLPYSFYNWNRRLAYGVKFDEVEIHRADLKKGVDGERFYSHPKNKLYDWRILKLHGSLNWLQYTGQKLLPYIPEETVPPKPLSDVILADKKWIFSLPPFENGWVLDPLIITPILYKEENYQKKPFADIWQQAKDSLSCCDRLIIIGYSFPPTDFAVKRLLLEAFKSNKLKELIVVNPDCSVANIAKELIHCGKPVLFNDLEQYLRSI